MSEIEWDVWLSYRKALKEANSKEERIKIESEFDKKYSSNHDPDDDTVLLAGHPTEA
jgi:hypothetical protein